MSGVEQQSPTTGFSMVLTPRAAEEVQKFITQIVGPCPAGP
jgi:hypothetical protein